jgi:hypothetical protein
MLGGVGRAGLEGAGLAAETGFKGRVIQDFLLKYLSFTGENREY